MKYTPPGYIDVDARSLIFKMIISETFKKTIHLRNCSKIIEYQLRHPTSYGTIRMILKL